MADEEKELTVAVPGLPCPGPAGRRERPAGRRGQTTVEYLLALASLLFVFVVMYKALSYAVANHFRRGGIVIIKMYKEDPW